MVDTQKVFPTLVGIIVAGLIGIYAYNKINEGSQIGTTPILAFILIGFGLFSFLSLAKNYGTGKLDLDNIFLPLVGLAVVVASFIYIPQLITNTFSIFDSNVQQVQSPLISFQFKWWYALIPLGVILLFKNYRNDLKRRLKL